MAADFPVCPQDFPNYLTVFLDISPRALEIIPGLAQTPDLMLGPINYQHHFQVSLRFPILE